MLTAQDIESVAQVVRKQLREDASKAPKIGSTSSLWGKVGTVASAAKYVWVATVFVFTAGVTFAYFRESLVMQEAFVPVRDAANRLPSLEEKVSVLEARYAGIDDDVKELHRQLGQILALTQQVASNQSELERKYALATLCSMHRDAYVAELADYVVQDRRRPPTRSDNYKRCMDS